MPFALLIVGIFLLVAGVNNKQGDLYTLVKGDFSGPNNFVFWIVSILVIGAVGYIPKLKPISDAFLVLVIVVLFLSKGSGAPNGLLFFQNLTKGLQSTTGQASAPGSTPLEQLQQQTQARIDQLKQQILATLP